MADINSMTGHLIRRLHQISASVFAERISEAGLEITPVQFAALEKISTNSGVGQTALAGLIAYDRVTICGVIDRLENKKFVIRKISETDRRARELHITEKGRQALDKLKPIVTSFQLEILTGLSPDEVNTFHHLLEKTTAAGNKLSRAPLHLT